ncbi:helix-turn-helix domain-containing protein [Fibrella aestuarina]|uniref:helix-turn-helix domain-containing protein n=1 Tax=Fibrella aestuarina TaxID=651143 RepID=UPI00059E3CF5|nr:helix-turn-helix transcriptional regulator [Fibrella aestuarina]
MTPHSDDIKQQVGSLIREARRTKGLTQKELADILEMDEKRLARLESGRMNPTISTLQRILNAAGCSVEMTLKL